MSHPTPDDTTGRRPALRVELLSVLGALVAVVAAGALLIGLADVWLLSFGGVLFAVALHGAGDALAKRSSLPINASVAMVSVLVALLLALALWSMGPAFAKGVGQLRDDLPNAIERVRSVIDARSGATELLDRASERLSDFDPATDLLGRVGQVFSTALGALSALGGTVVGVLVIAVIAIYGALAPSTYTGALLSVLPASAKPRAREVLSELAKALRWWLIGRICSMAVVGVLTWLGLWALGVPSAGTLGALAALLSFVPNIGPILSALPAVLLGFGEGATTALYVVALYASVQTVESYVITPLIQQRVVALPPAIVIVVQLAFGSALGLLGLLFATPLAVAAMVLIRKLWIESALEQDREADAS